MAKPWIYADTSAFLKLFIREPGTDRMRKLAKEHRLLSSAVITVESRSALARRRRDREISDSGFERVLARLMEGMLAVEMVRMTDEVLNMADDIVLRTPDRTMDALHIASAFVFQDGSGISLTFVTADKKQHAAALQAGLSAVLVG
jgi:predicted nucleic acid-binding protein